jgi:DNA-binding transcriptional MerR regulator/effector-binding domain-containing protein
VDKEQATQIDYPLIELLIETLLAAYADKQRYPVFGLTLPLRQTLNFGKLSGRKGRLMFRIGEFSKIAQVSGRLLRYYDELGLLSPVYTDQQTGYRYYSAQQLPRLNRILVLKELGLSLEQITRLLEQDTSTEELHGMLTLRKAQIEQTLQEEMTRLQMIESRLEQLNTHGEIQEPDIILKSIPAQGFLGLREVLPNMSAVRWLVEKLNSVVPALVGHSPLGYIAVIIHSPMYEPETFDLEIGFLLTGKVPEVLPLPNERILTVRELPAVETMATLAHIGPVEHRHRGYAALAAWLQSNSYEVSGVGREILVQLPIGVPEDEAVIELQLPAIKHKHKLGA